MIFAGSLGRAFVDQQLDEGTLFRGQFPRGGSFASAQADQSASDPDRLARAQFKVARQTVAFVEKTERGDAFRHRCSNLFACGCDEVVVGRGNFAFFGSLTGCIFVDIIAAEPATAGQQKHRRQN